VRTGGRPGYGAGTDLCLVPPIGNGAADALDAAKHVPAMERLTSLPGLAKPGDGTEEPVGDRLARWLNEHVIVDAAYEGDGVYRVAGANVCGDDAECVRKVDEAQIRVRAEIEGDEGLNLAVLVGPDRTEPFFFEIRPYAIKMTVEVAEIAATAAALGVGGIETAEGRVSARLARLRPQVWVAELAVEDAVRIEGEGGAVIAVAASNPTLSATVDLTARTLNLKVDLGTVTLRWPWEGTVLGIDLPGVTASAALGNDISVTGLGFGDRTAKVTLGAETLLALDWNPEAGRTVGLFLAEEQNLSLEPRLDVFLTARLQPLVAHGKAIDPWLLDEDYELHLGTMLQFLPGGGVKVQGEPMSFVAKKAGASLTVSTGMCLFEDPVTDGEQPLIGRLAAGACPFN